MTNPFLRAEFIQVPRDCSLNNLPLCGEILTNLGDEDMTIGDLRKHWTIWTGGTVTAAAQALAARFPVTVTMPGYPAVTPVADLIPWLNQAASKTLDDIEIAAVFALAGFVVEHDDDTPTVAIPPSLVAAEAARQRGFPFFSGVHESRWLPRPVITAEEVAEVLADMPGLSVGGVMHLPGEPFAKSRAELEGVSPFRIQRLSDCLITTFPAAVGITETDSVRDHHLCEWLRLRHPELGHVAPGELFIAAALSGYRTAVEDGAKTHDDLYFGVPRTFVDLYQNAVGVESPVTKRWGAAA